MAAEKEILGNILMGKSVKLTPVQRYTLIQMGRSAYGDLHFDGRTRYTAWALNEKGLISGGGCGWYSLTPEGRACIARMRTKR
jgi:hypothetical protein